MFDAARIAESGEPLLLSADQLARHLRTSRRTVWRLLSAGKLPREIRIGGSVRWRTDEIVRWIAAGAPERSEWEIANKHGPP